MNQLVIEMAIRALNIIDDEDIVSIEAILLGEGYTEQEIDLLMNEVRGA